MTTFGARLRDARKAAKLKQSEVTKRIGISQSLLSELENNEYPTSGYTTKLAYLYKVSARWLAEGKGPRDISTLELVDDPDVARVWQAYSALDEGSRAIVDYLLNGGQRPDWMSPGAAAAIANIKQLVEEQLEKNRPS